MEIKIYFEVQEIKKENCGNKTYITTISNRKNYHQDEVKKALFHYKKKKSNKIIMHCIEYLDDIPYIKHNTYFGERKYNIDNNESYVLFDKLGLKYFI